jgi:hypothetical protein
MNPKFRIIYVHVHLPRVEVAGYVVTAHREPQRVLVIQLDIL